MSNDPTVQTSPPGLPPRQTLITLGLCIGLSMAAGRETDAALRPEIGRWATFAASIVAATLMAVTVALVAQLLTRGRGGAGRP